MKNLLFLMALGCGLACSAQTVTLMSPQLKDTAGVPVADGIVSIAPTLCNGIPTAYRVIGGGTRTQTPVTVTVTAGLFSLPVADTAQTSPRICYAMTVRDRTTGAVLIGKGYDKMQPSATASWCSTVSGVTTCNVDNYDPNLVPIVPIGPAGAGGPQGPAGPPGAQGPPGTGSVVSDGSIPAGATGSDPVAAANTAANQVITVGPVTPPQNTVIPLFAGSAIRDIRPGYEGLRYLDCLVQSKMHDVRAGDGSHCRWDHVTFDGQTNIGFNQQGLHFNSLWSYGASANYNSNWRTVSVESVNATVANRGIFNGANLYYHHNAAGDINLHNLYAWFDSGWRTGADEGFTGIRGTFIQNPTYWHGTSLSAGTGLTMPLLSDSTAPASGAGENNNHTTDGGFVVNISKGTLSGTVTGPAVPVPGSAYLYQFPTSSTTLPLITAWGTCASAIAESAPAQTNQPISCVATVKAGTFTAGGLVLVAGQQGTSEQAPITAVSTKTGGVQTITIATRHRYAAGATVFQGPSALYASWDANLASTGMRTAYPTFGSLDGVNLIFGFYPQGTYTPNIPDCGKQAFCPGTTGRNGFHLYPGAEVRANLSLFHDPWLEPNSMVLAAGDLLEAPQPDEVYMTGLKLACSTATPANGAEQACDRVTVGGSGMVSNFAARLTLNTNNPAIYRANGGLYDGTPAHWIRGYFDHGHLFDIMPGIALTTVYNMNYLQQAGDHSLGNNRGLLYKMPSGNISWWDDVSRLYTPNIGADNYYGPATAPTGSCTTAQAGAWAFPQDGVASYCDIATHTWVPQVKQVVAGAGIQVTSTTPTSLTIATAAIPVSSLANPAATVNGQTCTLGSTCTVAAAAATLTGSALPSAITSAPGLAAAFDLANAAATAQAASLQKSQNLADVASASTARTNLGLGTAATQPSTAFDASGAASTAQAASMQKSANLSDVASNSAAATNVTTFIKTQTGCTTAGYVWLPATGTCVTPPRADWNADCSVSPVSADSGSNRCESRLCVRDDLSQFLRGNRMWGEHRHTERVCLCSHSHWRRNAICFSGVRYYLRV